MGATINILNSANIALSHVGALNILDMTRDHRTTNPKKEAAEVAR